MLPTIQWTSWTRSPSKNSVHPSADRSRELSMEPDLKIQSWSRTKATRCLIVWCASRSTDGGPFCRRWSLRDALFQNLHVASPASLVDLATVVKPIMANFRISLRSWLFGGLIKKFNFKDYKLYLENKMEDSRRLFSQILPILSFTHQHIDISIKFSKMLRVEEGIFSTSICREPIKNFDQFQLDEASLHISKVLELQNNLKNN